VDDALIVRRFERFGDLFGNREGFINRNRAFRNAIRQGGPLDQLEDERQNASVLLYSVDMTDIGMTQRGQHLRFALESCQALRIRGECLGEDLDRYFAVEL
jgi:hypothetical protein